MEMLRVLAADDHLLFRDGLRALLEAAGDLELVGEATTGDEAVELAAALRPDVMLMDIQMPGMSGIAATRRIVEASPDVRVLVVTMFEDDNTVFAAMRAGARGYVLKGASYTEMLRAIRAVGSGEGIFSPAIAGRMMQFFASLQPSVPPQLFPELSDREREIVQLLAQGLKNTEIAEQLYLSPKTVRNHVSTIFSKLQVADRVEAIVRAGRGYGALKALPRPGVNGRGGAY